MSAQQDPSDLIDQAEGRSLTTIARDGVGGWILAVWISFISGTQQVFEFLILPFTIFLDVAEEAVGGFILAPIGVVESAAEITAREVSVFGFFALPAGALIALGTLAIVVFYLRREGTSNFLPGLFVDNRLYAFIFTTPEEEAQGED